MTTDAKENQKDTIQETGQDSAEQQRDSKKQKVYTEDEVEKKFSTQRSALDKQIAEAKATATKALKAIEEANARATTAEEALKKAERAKDEAEYERVRGNPDALSDFQAKKAIKDAQSQLAKERAEIALQKAEHADDMAALNTWKIERSAQDIASKHKGVDYKDLIELTDGSAEKMEKMAVKLEKIPTTETAATKETEEENEPDSGEGRGHSGKSSMKQLAEMPMEEYERQAKERYK
jgi:hypothetical protein